MNFSNMITTIDTHTQGEPTRIVTAGIGPIPGSDMRQKKQWVTEHRDHLRQMLMWEPRGHQDMFGALITEPCNPEAHVGVIFMDGGGYLDMCGHGSMGVVTALLETGMVTAEPATHTASVLLDTPAGLIRGKAVMDRQGRVGQVTIRNQPSFWVTKILLNVGSFEEVPVDIAYGGNYFALVDVSHFNLTVTRRHIDKLKKLGLAVREAANQNCRITHPASGLPGEIALTEIYETTEPARNTVIFGSGQVDRSPCGTGTSAKMALLHHQGRLAVGEAYRYQSIFGTEFIGSIVAETRIGESTGVIPEISGSAYITGFHQFTADPDDIYKYGFQTGAVDARNHGHAGPS